MPLNALKFSFVLDKRTANAKGGHPLKLQISRTNKERVLIGLGIALLPHQWDARREKIIGTPAAETDNHRLNNYRVKVGKVLFAADESGDNPTMPEIRELVEIAIGQKAARPTMFYAYADAYAAKITVPKTKEAAALAIRKAREFDPVDRPFSQITAGWLRDFDTFCRAGGMKVNAISVYLRNLRTIYNRAIDDGVAQLNDYPFRRFKIKSEKTRKRALTVEQIRALRDYPCTESQRQYRDIFMLIFYLGGINLVDLFSLTKIDDGYVYYSRSKTHRPYQIKVEPEALAIIERYRGTDYLLAAADRYRNHEDFTRRINRALRVIGAPLAEKSDSAKPGPPPVDKAAGAFPGLTTYWARHSWATIARSIGVSKDDIAAVLGHGDNTVTDIYLDYDQRVIDRAIRAVIDHTNG